MHKYFCIQHRLNTMQIKGMRFVVIVLFLRFCITSHDLTYLEPLLYGLFPSIHLFDRIDDTGTIHVLSFLNPHSNGV